MAESNITWNGTPITDLHRDALSLQKINENGTVEEMIDTINSNFLEIAKHGGGPAGIDGNNGIDGVDGVNVEYIYAHCDSIKPEDGGTKFPNDTPGKEDLFTRVDINGSATYKGNVTWFDHPNGVSPDHKNEYVFSRFRRNENSQWFYADAPVLWSHWGEKGMDGDGVEYIFMLSREELDNTSAKSKIFKVSNLNEEQKVIYNIDDFFPGRNWFNTTNGTKAWTALKNAGYTYDQATFMSLFNAPNYFGFPCVDNNWTDDPIGPNIEYNYEYVSIRRSNTDETGKKVWGDYSDPALWSNYSLEGRIFMIYCNTDKDATPVAPQAGQGRWDIANDRLILNGLLAGWTDDNRDKEDGEITWMSSGIFNHSGNNVSWSKPVCISGKDGKDGEDGTNIQFIYALSSMPEYPSVRSEQERLFDAIEQATTNPKYDTYGDTVWYDRAQPISPTDRTEYMWARRRDKESDPWDYDPMPIIWAHWGEDGTDGDGVEYIFTTTDVYIEPENIESHPELSLPKYSALNEEQKKLFQIDDFVPSKYWFDKKKNGIYTNKEKAETALGRTIALSEWLGYFGFGTYPGWTDNPISVTPYEPYQWVSIRRSTADEFDGKRFWEDFSVPVLWNSFGKGTRIFVVYCNVDGDEKPRKPVGGFWYSGNNEDKLVASSTDLSDYKYAIFDDFTPDYDSFIGYWNDKNIDVENTITWMSSGVFTDDGMNVSWSEPFRLTGASGLNGADGNNQTFVYALSDVEPVWPEGESYEKKIEFFENVEGADSEEWTEHPNGYEYEDPVSHRTTVWYDNPQGIENVDGKRTEWVWSKTLPANATATTKWEFAPHPIIWAHWGEDGTDGDGLEYIFFRSTQKNQNGTLPAEMKPVKKADLVNDVQRTIFNIDDFYPGDGWFVTTPVNNKERARTALEKAGLYDESTFESDWNNKFDIPIVGGGDANKPCWTDNPIGSDLAYPFEWVSIRRSHPNAQGKREWDDFGEPSIWTSYNMRTRIFIVYCCVDEGNPPQPPTGGWWDGTNDGGLITSKEGYELSSPWTDRDTSIPGKISYLSSGLFAENGENIYWSAPFRMTGAQGRPGADGSNIEFVYALSEEEPQFPAYTGDDTSYTKVMNFFDNVEGAHSDEDTEHEGFVYTENGKSTEWFDNPQGIANEDGKRKEWVWSRSLPANSNVWTFPESPVIWAHWGEDGTDGDGVEYIFSLGTTPTYALNEETWNSIWSAYTSDTAKAIYAMDDFVPNPEWFANQDNMEAVRNAMIENGKTFSGTDWTSITTATMRNFTNLQNWTDNPRSVTYQYQYQYVSIRKMVDGVWQPFSYPQVWANYSFSQYDAFAFVAVDAGIELGEYQPIGGNFMNPKPSDATFNNVQLHWTDGPEATSQYQTIWMTKAKVSEKYNMADNSITWSHPQRMADSNVFQVEWSQTDKSVTELISINSALAAPIGEEVTDPNNSSIKYTTYNFGEYLRKNGNDEDAAEAAWRYVVNSKLHVLFGDNSSKSILMATCQVKNNEWTDWVINRVKGEKGEAGTSINVTGHITYERYLDNNTYTHATAEAKFESDKPTNPKDEELLIVYPKDPNEYGLYYGDDTNSLGGALYMWQYIEGTGWTEFVLNNTNNGNAYTSPNGHLILWDGDSFQDVGNIVGPAGPINKIIIAFADDDPDHPGQKIRVQEGNEPGAKWIGFLTYTEGTEDEQPLDNINDSRWIWSHFKGQDGYGMEYIFKATATKDADHSVPYNINWRSQDGVEPDGWEDEDIEPNATDKRYVWMCWRKYDPTSGKWSDFKGAQGKTGAPGQNGVARLWSVFAESIERVEEYYHADPSSSPSDMFMGGLNGMQIIGNGGSIDEATIRYFGDYWRPKSEVIGTDESYSWNKTNKYLFNREVIIYSNGNSDALDPHLISVWADGLIDVVEYYCLDGDGSSAPMMGNKDGKLVPYIDQENNNPGLQPSPSVLTPENEGKMYWTTNPSAMSMDQTYKFLWNISYRIFQEESYNSWSDPYVIGIYGKGENGDSAVYADLDNEMDAISVNEDGRVMFDITCTTILTLYNGSDIVKMRDCDISGEEKFKSINTSRPSCKVEYTTDINAANPNWVEYNDTVIEEGFDAIRLTLNLKKNDQITSPEYSKITFAPTSIDGDVREVSYVVIGVTNASIYSVVPTYNSILELEDNNGVKSLDQSALTAYVLERSGNQSNIIRHDISNKLILEVYLNGSLIDPTSSVTGYDAYGFGIIHTNDPDVNSSENQYKVKLKAGDKIKYVLNVKTNTTTTGSSYFTMDTETIYVLKQGKDGQPGLPGNGYEYCYIRYDKNESYGSNPIASVTQATAADEPTFMIGNKVVASTSEPQGADSNHPYEYRSQRSGFDTSWSKWSRPVTVAKYLDTEDIQGTVDAAVNAAKASLLEDVDDSISSALSTYEYLKDFINEDGTYSGAFADELATGMAHIVTNTDLTGKISTTLNGIIANETSVNTFSDWISDTDQSITSVNQFMSANGEFGQLKSQVTGMASDIAGATAAVNDMQVIASERFASIESRVGNTSYLTDEDGYYLMNQPKYTIWAKNESLLEDVSDFDEGLKQKWMFFVYNLNGTTRTSYAPIDYEFDTLYNTDRTKRIVILKKIIDPGQYSLYTHLDYMPNALKNYVTIKNVTTSSFDFELSSSASLYAKGVTKDEPELTSCYVIITAWAQVSVTDANQTNLTWKVGVSDYHNMPATSSASSGSYYYPTQTTGTYTYPSSFYALTGSVYEEPYMAANGESTNALNIAYVLSGTTSYSYYVLYEKTANSIYRYTDGGGAGASVAGYNNLNFLTENEIFYNKRIQAKDSDGNPTKNYRDIIPEHKPYLISVVSEIAAISQSVSDGVSVVSILAAVNDDENNQIAAAIFAEANQNGSNIMLNADHITLSSSHKLSLSSGTFVINSENFKIDENGYVTAKGSIMADKFESTSNVTYPSDSTISTTSDYVGTLNKSTLVDSKQFNISANGTLNKRTGSGTKDISNSLYITLIDEIDNENSDIQENGSRAEKLYAVPTLCMMYNGVPYVLNPSSWKSLYATAQSNMRFLSKYNILKYTVSSSLPTSSTNNVNNTYFYKSTSATVNGSSKSFGSYIITPDNGVLVSNKSSDKLYRLQVLSWGNAASTEAGYMVSNSLKGSSSTSDKTDCAYTTYSRLNRTKYTNPGMNEMGTSYIGSGSMTSITSDNCQILNFFLPDSTLTFGVNDSQYCTYSQGFDTSDYTITSDWGADKLFNLAKTLLTDSSNSMMYGHLWSAVSEPIMSGDYTKSNWYHALIQGLDNFIPFTNSDRESDGYIEISVYPMCTINSSNFTTCNTTISKVLVNVHVNMKRYNNTGISGKLIEDGDELSFNIRQFIIDMNFDLLLNFSGSNVFTNYNPDDSSTYDNILKYVKAYLEGSNFPYSGTNSLTYNTFKAYFYNWININAFVYGSNNVMAWGVRNSNGSNNIYD